MTTTEETMMTWRPIETAPKDGTFIWVGERLKIPEWWVCVKSFSYQKFDGKKWVDKDGRISEPQPTHWQILSPLEDNFMEDIKLRNVKLEDATNAIGIIRLFLKEYPGRFGFQKGVVYSSPKHKPSFYVYNTAKTIICVGHYADDENILVDFKRIGEN